MPDPILMSVIISGAYNLSQSVCRQIDVNNIAADRIKREADKVYNRGIAAFDRLGQSEITEANMNTYVEAIGNLLASIPLMERVPPRRDLFLFVFNIANYEPVNEALRSKCEAHRRLSLLYGRVGNSEGEQLSREHEAKYLEIWEMVKPPPPDPPQRYSGYGV